MKDYRGNIAHAENFGNAQSPANLLPPRRYELLA